MTDLLADLRNVQRLNGDTYSSAEVLGMVGRAAGEIERLRAALREIADSALTDYAKGRSIARAALEGK